MDGTDPIFERDYRRRGACYHHGAQSVSFQWSGVGGGIGFVARVTRCGELAQPLAAGQIAVHREPQQNPAIPSPTEAARSAAATPIASNLRRDRFAKRRAVQLGLEVF